MTHLFDKDNGSICFNLLLAQTAPDLTPPVLSRPQRTALERCSSIRWLVHRSNPGFGIIPHQVKTVNVRSGAKHEHLNAVTESSVLMVALSLNCRQHSRFLAVLIIHFKCFILWILLWYKLNEKEHVL